MKDQKLISLKNECEAFILTHIQPFEQANAALGVYEPARCEAIKNYIAACRNEYLRCKALVLSATTNDEADAIQFNAPVIPEVL